jgi:hypothetical protein
MKRGVQRYLIVRCEKASKNYTTEFVQQLFSEEGKGEVCTIFIYNLSLFSLPPESTFSDMRNKEEIPLRLTETWAQN